MNIWSNNLLQELCISAFHCFWTNSKFSLFLCVPVLSESLQAEHVHCIGNWDNKCAFTFFCPQLWLIEISYGKVRIIIKKISRLNKLEKAKFMCYKEEFSSMILLTPLTFRKAIKKKNFLHHKTWGNNTIEIKDRNFTETANIPKPGVQKQFCKKHSE